jgi:putative FmdB family regulatory protein
MPMYEYKCSECEHQFEELVSSGTVSVACPKCGSEKTQKLLSVFAASAGSASGAPSCGSAGCGSGFS